MKRLLFLASLLFAIPAFAQSVPSSCVSPSFFIFGTPGIPYQCNAVTGQTGAFVIYLPSVAATQTYTASNVLTVNPLPQIIHCNASSGNVILTLPANAYIGEQWNVVKTDSSSFACTIAAATGETIGVTASASVSTNQQGSNIVLEQFSTTGVDQL